MILRTLAILFLLALNISADNAHYSVKVTIKGFPDNSGNSYVALYRSTDDFPVHGKQFKGIVAPIKEKRAEVSFTNVSSGKYAVAVFHDKNKSGKLDKNMLGIPTESYGFSNNARETFSAPSFSSASFEVKKNTEISILVK
jgi:uncharacterized protein (DUF2141 family)